MAALASLRPAPSIRRRIASMLYECLLLLGVLSVTFMLPHIAIGLGFAKTLPGWLLLLHLLLILLGYFVWFWQHGGQTLAMKTWKIRLENALGTHAVSLPQACLRFALCWPSLLFFGVGVFWAVFDRERQFLHDRLAGTRLVSGP
ncbi:MAG: RDD family protein [Proteobacteria bacterium]|nr:RDD family protein [Pseudomonadota bacterium]